MAKRVRQSRTSEQPAEPPARPPESGSDLAKRDARRWWIAVGAIAAGACLIRALFFIELHQTPMWWALLGDGQSYDEWARRLAAGDWMGSDVFYQTPLYPYLLGVLFSLVGHSLGAVRVLQALFGAASCVLIAMAGRRFFDRRTGLIAAVLIAIYPEAIFFDGLIQKSSLDLFLMASLLASLAAFLTGPRVGPIAVAGVILGAFVLNRENALVLIPVLAIWLLLAFRPEPIRTRVAWVGALVAGALLLTAPVALRNYSISGELAISTSQFGPNFYIGNHLGATGTYKPLVAGQENANQERADATRLAEQAEGRKLSPGQVSQYWFRRTMTDIGGAPLRWAGLMARKLLMTINTGEFVDSESLAEDAQFSRVLRITRVFSFGLLLALAAGGVWLTRDRWRELAVLYAIPLSLLTSIALFYVFSRYRYPVTPVLALFAGATIAALFRRPFDPRLWTAPAAAFLIAGAVSYIPLTTPPTQTFYNLAIRLSQMGRRAEAKPWLDRAIAATPDDPLARLSLGRLYLENGEAEAAIPDLQRAVALAPDLAEAHATLGHALGVVGRSAEALTELEATVRLTPDAAAAHTNYGVALWYAGQQEAAIAQYRETVRLQPDDPIGHNNLALALYQTGRAAEAAAGFEKALTLKSDYSEAHSNFALLLTERGDLDQALRHFEAALGSQPTNFGINVNAGDLLMKMHRPADAAVRYKAALANAPDSIEPVLTVIEHLAQALIDDNKPADARPHLQRGLALAKATGQTEAVGRIEELLRRVGR